MVTAFSLSRRLDAYYAVKEAYSEYRGDGDDASFAVGEDLIVEVLTNLSALREGYLDPELDWATLQAMCLYHLYGGNAQMYSGDVQLYGGNAQLYGGNTQMYSGNTQLYSGNAQLHGSNAQMYGGNNQLYSGNTQMYDGNTQPHTEAIVLGHGDAHYRIDLVNTPQGRQMLKPGILQHLLTSGRNKRQVFEGQQVVVRQEVVSTTLPSAEEVCELPSQNSRPVKISIVDITQNKATSTTLNQSIVPSETVSADVVTAESGNPVIVPAETVSPAIVSAETISHAVMPAESNNPAMIPAETISPDIVPAESASLASKDDTPTVRVIHDYQASYVAYVGQTKCTPLDSLPAIMGPPESWELHVPESLHWRRRKGSQFGGGIKREPTHHKSKKDPRQPTDHATKRPSKPKKTAHPMRTRTQGTCRRSKHAIDVNAAFPYQMELDAENAAESRHKCGVCSAICETRLLVVKHMWEKHKIHLRRLHGYDKAVVCNICGQMYVQRKCMMKHMREHRKVAQGSASSRMGQSDDGSHDSGLETHYMNAHKLVSVVVE